MNFIDGDCELEKMVEQFDLNDRQDVRGLTENLWTWQGSELLHTFRHS